MLGAWRGHQPRGKRQRPPCSARGGQAESGALAWSLEPAPVQLSSFPSPASGVLSQQPLEHLKGVSFNNPGL